MIEQEEKSTVKNIVMYFILPMLQLNKSSFGVGNFINSYVDRNGYVVVDIEKIAVNGNIANATYNHKQYVTDYDIDGGVRVVYAVPDEFIPDIVLFEQGKYSQLSAALKVAISKEYTGSLLNCLNPSLVDRQKIADELHVKVDIVHELKSAPIEQNFIKIK